MKFKKVFARKAADTAAFSYDKSIFVLGLTIFLILFFLGNLENLKTNLSPEAFLEKNDKVLLQYKEYKKQFNFKDYLIVAVETDDMFSQEKLHKLKELHEDLSANVKYIKSVDSLVNAKTISGDKNLIEVSYLIKDSSEKIEERIMTEDSFKKLLLLK